MKYDHFSGFCSASHRWDWSLCYPSCHWQTEFSFWPSQGCPSSLASIMQQVWKSDPSHRIRPLGWVLQRESQVRVPEGSLCYFSWRRQTEIPFCQLRDSLICKQCKKMTPGIECYLRMTSHRWDCSLMYLLWRRKTEIPLCQRRDAFPSCNRCGRSTPQMKYDHFSGFCSASHRWDWSLCYLSCRR